MSEDYAIIHTSGKQYKVTLGSTIAVDRMPGQPGDEVTCNNVLLVRQGDNVQIGSPFVSGASVKLELLAHDRGPKVVIFKKRSKKGYKKTLGHRQDLTQLRVKEIKNSSDESRATSDEAR